jgi:hypothetical protein
MKAKTFDCVEKKVGQILLAGLGDKEQGAIMAFRRALKRRQGGKGEMAGCCIS